MFDPSSMTLGQVSSILRDFAIVAVLLRIGWMANGWLSEIKSFATRVTQHMTRMERFATIVLNNHLKHIEADLKTLSGRKEEFSADDLDLTLDAAE
jgi:hypothetical protein